MVCRAVWLAFVLLGSAGCSDAPYSYSYREPCEASPEDCCPPGTRELSVITPNFRAGGQPGLEIICVLESLLCGDAGAGTSVCQDAGTDAP